MLPIIPIFQHTRTELVINNKKSDKASLQSQESVHTSYSIIFHSHANNFALKFTAGHKK